MSIPMTTMALTLMLPTLCFAQAEIKLKTGRSLKVQSIVKAGSKSVVYKIAGTRQRVRSDEVREIVLADQRISAGLRELEKGDYSSALKQFERARQGEANQELKAFATYHRARALSLSGQLKKAKVSYRSFLERYPNHFYSPRACFEFGSFLERLGQFDEARRSYQSAKIYGGRRISKIKYSMGQSYLRESRALGNAEIAKKGEAYFTDLLSNEDYKILASLSLGRLSIAGNDVRRARSQLKNAKKELVSVSERALFHLAWGELLQSEKKSDDALYKFLYTFLYFGGTDYGRQAQRQAIQLSRELNYSNLARQCQSYRLRSNRRITGMNKEFIEAIYQSLSASFALKKLNNSLEGASKDELRDLLFLKYKILVTLNRGNDHKALLERLKREYPAEIARQHFDVRVFVTTLSQLKRQWTDHLEEAKKDEIRAQLASFLKKLKASLALKFKLVEEKVEAIEKAEDEYHPDLIKAKRAKDRCHFLYGDALYFFALTLDVKDERRLQLLVQAEKTLDDFTSECEQFSIELLGRAYNLYGLAILEQGKTDRAIEEFEALKEYSTPFGPEFRRKNPKLAQEIKKLEDVTRINAFRHQAKAYLKIKKTNAALTTFKELKSRVPNHESYREGLLAHFESCDALARAGQLSLALEEIQSVIDRADELKIALLSKDIIELECCKALASLSEASGGALFPAKLQFQAGLGFQMRGDDEAAIVGYKGVLSSAETKTERSQWVPKACQEMARLLYHKQRYIEAALAFSILADEFPKHPEAIKALKKAKKSLSKAIQVHKEEDKQGPLHRAQNKIEQSLLNRGSVESKVRILFKRAAQLESRKQYLKAANAYLSIEKAVPKEKNSSYQSVSLIRAGYCYLKHGRDSQGSQSYAQARNLFRRARELARAQRDSKNLQGASYYLGMLANLEKKYKEALRELSIFESKKESVPEGRVIAQQITAYIGIHDSSNAEKCYKSLDQRNKRVRAQLAFQLCAYFEELASKEQSKAEKNQALTQSYQSKAADYAFEWLRASENLKRSSLFWAASLIMDGQRYAKAVSVYERLFNQFPRPEINGNFLGKKAQAEATLHDQYDLAKMNLARAYLIAGKAKEAAKLFTELKGLVVIKKKNTLIARGEFIKEARETLRDDKGRPVRCRVYYVKEKSGEVTYFVPPRQSPSQVLKGKDASQSFAKRDLMTLRQRFKTKLLVLSGLAEATWQQYRKSGDKNALVNEVQKSWNNYYRVLSRLDDSVYNDLKALYHLKDTYTDARMSAALRLLEIAYEREQYRDISIAVRNFEDSGWLSACSSKLRKQIHALEKRATEKIK